MHTLLHLHPLTHNHPRWRDHHHSMLLCLLLVFPEVARSRSIPKAPPLVVEVQGLVSPPKAVSAFSRGRSCKWSVGEGARTAFRLFLPLLAAVLRRLRDCVFPACDLRPSCALSDSLGAAGLVVFLEAASREDLLRLMSYNYRWTSWFRTK